MSKAGKCLAYRFDCPPPPLSKTKNRWKLLEVRGQVGKKQPCFWRTWRLDLFLSNNKTMCRSVKEILYLLHERVVSSEEITLFRNVVKGKHMCVYLHCSPHDNVFGLGLLCLFSCRYHAWQKLPHKATFAERESARRHTQCCLHILYPTPERISVKFGIVDCTL